jgi:hypothetical protein
VAIGLLLLSISAPLSLAEERDRGSLDVINATALPTRSIVWGKWLGTFAIVPRLIILPSWVTVALAMVTGYWVGVLVLVMTIGAAAAVITSLGLALATCHPRANRAVAVSLLAYVLWIVGTLVVPWFLPWPGDENLLLLVNPCVHVFVATLEAGSLLRGDSALGSPGFVRYLGWIMLAIGMQLVLAAGLFAATLRSYDRCLGRLPDRPWVSRRRGERGWGALVGGICGATGAFTVLCVAIGSDEVVPPVLVITIIIVGLGAFIGMAAGWGVIGPTGWAMLAGGLLGWAAVGTLAVVMRQDAWGIVDGAILGAPLGLFLGLMLGLDRERKHARARSAQ